MCDVPAKDIFGENECTNLCGIEPQLIKLEFIIYLPKLKVFLLFSKLPKLKCTVSCINSSFPLVPPGNVQFLQVPC